MARREGNPGHAAAGGMDRSIEGHTPCWDPGPGEVLLSPQGMDSDSPHEEEARPPGPAGQSARNRFPKTEAEAGPVGPGAGMGREHLLTGGRNELVLSIHGVSHC